MLDIVVCTHESTRFPGKNSLEFLGKSLIRWTEEFAETLSTPSTWYLVSSEAAVLQQASSRWIKLPDQPEVEHQALVYQTGTSDRVVLLQVNSLRLSKNISLDRLTETEMGHYDCVTFVSELGKSGNRFDPHSTGYLGRVHGNMVQDTGIGSLWRRDALIQECVIRRGVEIGADEWIDVDYEWQVQGLSDRLSKTVSR